LVIGWSWPGGRTGYGDRRGGASWLSENCRLHARIGTMDLKIAAIVLSKGDTLLSRNLSEFGRISGLKVEDWTA
jgi:predicted nucleic acid-binding protein